MGFGLWLFVRDGGLGLLFLEELMGSKHGERRLAANASHSHLSPGVSLSELDELRNGRYPARHELAWYWVLGSQVSYPIPQEPTRTDGDAP